VNTRLRAVCDLVVADVREGAGRHEYDGVVQDLSPAGVAAGLARLGDGPAEPDPHDEAHLAAFEDQLRVAFGEVEEHRRNPYVHIANLDLSVYDREYAPPEEREDARRRHLAAWPDAVDAALEALDRVSRPVAAGLLEAARGLAAGIAADDGPAVAAHARLVAHLEDRAAHGDADPAVGGSALARLMGSGEGMAVDLGRLAERADAERNRLRGVLREACASLDGNAPPEHVVPALLRDHLDADGIQREAEQLVADVDGFTRDRDLLPPLDGECRVGPAPPARRWAGAMMAWAGPYEADAPSWYYVTPPDPDWSPEEQEQWLEVFSRTTLPAITVHEVTPGHFAHGRMLRRAHGDVRRTLHSMAFAEGWAHYGEELFVEEGFRAGDPRFAVGVAVEALLRVTRLAVAIGVHSGTMTMDEAVRRFEVDAFHSGPAARAEANRATFDPTYGRYTWGTFEILALRDEARARWGPRYTHRRFHEALLALGSPPLGLMEAIFDGA
jgi:hypothetical protein